MTLNLNRIKVSGFALVTGIILASITNVFWLSAQNKATGPAAEFNPESNTKDVSTAKQSEARKPTTKADPFPASYPDPTVPLMQLPANFRARRTTANISAEEGKKVEILNVKGAGCVRHLWFVFGEKNIDDLDIEILVDESAKPQVRMPLRSFFGTLLGFEDYHINSAGLVNFPNFTVKNDPLIPSKAQPGWNFYLPIPFSRNCRISLYSKSPKNGAAMIDWQQY